MIIKTSFDNHSNPSISQCDESAYLQMSGQQSDNGAFGFQIDETLGKNRENEMCEQRENEMCEQSDTEKH